MIEKNADSTFLEKGIIFTLLSAFLDEKESFFPLSALMRVYCVTKGQTHYFFHYVLCIMMHYAVSLHMVIYSDWFWIQKTLKNVDLLHFCILDFYLCQKVYIDLLYCPYIKVYVSPLYSVF